MNLKHSQDKKYRRSPRTSVAFSVNIFKIIVSTEKSFLVLKGED